MGLYTKFPKSKQTIFLRNVKNKINITWDNLALKVGKSKYTLFAYLREDCVMNYNVFLILIKLAKLRKSNFNYKLIEIKNERKIIKIPKLNNSLAEFLGVLAGDGHLSGKPYEVSVTGHSKLDKHFFEVHLYDIVKNLFNVESTIFDYGNNAKKFRIYSKKLVNYINFNFGHPIGKKKGKLNIPLTIFNNKKLLICYIRGLFDTDGSFYGRRNNEPVLEIISRDPNHLSQVLFALNKLGFNKANVYGKNLVIYNKYEIDKFFKEIIPANKRHTLKYNSFKSKGIIPKYKEICVSSSMVRF